MDRSPRRDLLVALNACLELSRDSVCRLAGRLDDWAGSHPRDRLAVSSEQLAIARARRATAAEASAAEHARAAAAGARIVTLDDPDYPPSLGDLELPPPVLYCRGSLPEPPALAMVGSRRADPYGLAAADLFASRLAEAGLVIVSGAARGIDRRAHEAALRPGAGRTVAVLGCGLDVDYPRGSRALRERIVARGCLLSEFPMGAMPRRQNFPVRNRIIAALGFACLVVQAAVRSGSLITAHHALELGRPVFALPGRIFDERSQGCNRLIRDGAHPVLEPDDVLEALPLSLQQRLQPPSEASPAAPQRDGLAGLLLAACPCGEPVPLEHLVRRLGSSPEETLATLLELELDGLVARHPGPSFSRTRP